MKYKGIITPMITPFDRKGKISKEYTVKLLEVLKENGVHGLFPLGSTGLFPFLSKEERMKFLEIVKANCHDLPILAGIGSPNTQESIELARHALNIGVNAVVLMPPYYIKPDQNEIMEHFSSVLDQVDIDFFIYNIPQLAGQWVSVETMQYLKNEYSQIKGVKDSAGDMRFFQRVVTLSDNNFSILQGQDDLLYLSMLAGADGGICGTTNISDETVRIYNHLEKNQGAISLKKQLEVVNPMMDFLNSSVFPSGYYYAFYSLNNISGGYRSPMTKPDSGKGKQISSGIKEILENSIKYK